MMTPEEVELTLQNLKFRIDALEGPRRTLQREAGIIRKRLARVERRRGLSATENSLASSTDLRDLGDIKTFLDFEEPALTPVTPPANVARIYAADDAGVTRPYAKDSDGLAVELAGYTLLASVTLGATAQLLADFASIPAKFRNLRVVWNGVSAAGATTLESIALRFNGDTGNNYYRQYQDDGVQTTALNVPFIIVGALNGVTTGHESWGYVDIMNYKNTNFNKGIVFAGGWIQSGNIVSRSGVGSWQSTVAINRIELLSTAATANWAVNSVAYLYGY